MSAFDKYLLMSIGLILSIIGIILFLRKKDQSGVNQIKLLGIEANLSAPSLVIFIVGVVLIVSPFIIPTSQAPISTSDRTYPPQNEPSEPKASKNQILIWKVGSPHRGDTSLRMATQNVPPMATSKCPT